MVFVNQNQGGSSGFGSFGGTSDTSSVDGLLEIARMQGGSIGQTAEELVHPRTSILSTMGEGFKNAFSTFVDIISTPSEVVAGIISPEYTVGEAIKQNIRPSDVIWGDQEEGMTTMQKVGSFSVRLATDVLLDPLTYVTFGAGSGGLFGARAASKITVGEELAKKLALNPDDVATLSKEGQEVLGYLQKYERQATGLTSGLELGKRLELFKGVKSFKAGETGVKVAKEAGDEVFDFAEKQLKELLEDTIDAPLDMQFAKQALSRTLAKFPQLSETLLDKGGIKFFNKSILSGQRIRSVTSLIPGMTALDQYTLNTRLAIGSLFDPAIIKDPTTSRFTRLPPEYMDFVKQVQDMAGNLRDERVLKLTNIARENALTSGEAKFMMASVEAGKIPADERLARVYKQLIGFNDDELKYLQAQGIRISRLDRHAPHVLVSSGIKTLPFKMPPSTKVGAAVKREIEGTIFETTDIALNEMEKSLLTKNPQVINETFSRLKNDGFEIFDDNFVSASIVRSMNNVRQASMKSFIDAIAKNFAHTVDDAPTGYVGLGLSKFKAEEEFFIKMGLEENRLRFHPAIAKHLETYIGEAFNDASTQGFLRAYDGIQNLWKASVTSIFPAFHGRNAISNVFLNFNDIGLEALNPATQAMSMQVMGSDMKLNGLYKQLAKGEDVADEISELLSKDMFTDISGYKWTFGELRQVIKNNAIALRKDVVGQIDTATRRPEELIGSIFEADDVASKATKIAKTSANPLSQQFKPYEYGRAVGNMVEGNARLVNFITNLRNTGDVQLATARTKQFLFDYNYLTAFEKNVMKRVLPFYTFTRKNLEAQVDTLLTAPGRTAAQVTALTTLGEVMAGGSLSDEERAALPDWIKTGIGILGKKDGANVEIFGSLGTPTEAPFQQFQPNALLGSISPVLRVPTEQLSGYSFFHGKMLSEVTNASAYRQAPDSIKQIIGYTEVSGKRSDGSPYTLYISLRPDMMNLLNNLPPTSRVINAIKQMDSQDTTVRAKALQFILGAKAYSFDIEREQAKRERETRQKLEKLLTDAGVTAQFTRTYIPKE